MKLTGIIPVPLMAAFLLSGVSVAIAQSAAASSRPSWWLPHAQVRALTRDQPSAENCLKLEDYFRGRAANYRRQAEESNAIVAQLELTAQHGFGKLAQSIDSGRRLRDYYLQMARKMDNRAAYWDHRRQQLQ